jgi:hypothetical protein
MPSEYVADCDSRIERASPRLTSRNGHAMGIGPIVSLSDIIDSTAWVRLAIPNKPNIAYHEFFI